jgi:hypothetical protein
MYVMCVCACVVVVSHRVMGRAAAAARLPGELVAGTPTPPSGEEQEQEQGQGPQQVSCFRALIGSPCLSHCVHGASIADGLLRPREVLQHGLAVRGGVSIVCARSISAEIYLLPRLFLSRNVEWKRRGSNDAIDELFPVKR